MDAHNREVRAKIAEANRRHFSAKMKNLQIGMNLREVEDVIGPINESYKTLMTALIEKRQPGMRITFENGDGGAMQVVDDAPDGHLKSLYTYHGNGFTLVFDWNGKLKSFSATPATAATK